MRTPPEHRRAHPRAGRTYEEDLNLRYLAPGAFTILPPDDGAPPLPPSAPAPYRLTPSTKRHKNPAFAIIGEPTSSNHGSRSSSPSGRVSPFKGRGFNATGSRFASPNPSPPPPEDARLTPTKVSPRHTSKIPKYSRRGSATAFGEKVIHYEPSFGTKDPQGSTRRNNLNSNQLSQSLSSLEAKQQTSSRKRPPISPRKRPHSKAIAFQRLSPIIGSSPEPSQSQSSPSRIPTKSRSTPPSRFTSPTRLDNEKKSVSKPPSRSVSRSQLRPSRDPSPSDNSSSSTAKNTGVKKSYRNVQAKVNSFSRPKPKVPPKPQFVSEQSEESDIPPSKNSNNKTKPTLSRNNSITKRTNDNKSSILQKTFNKNQVNNNNSDSSSTDTSKKINKNNSGNVNISNTVPNTKNNVNNNKPTTDKAKNQTSSKTNNNSSSNKNISKRNSREDLLTLPKTQMKQTHPDSSDSTTEDTDQTKDTNHHPLPSAVVSSTTSTVTKPLHIEAKLPTATYDRPKPVSPMVDGRILSATSVSHALNKMNDTVMNTQTVIKEHGLGKLSPAASAVIAVANEEKDKDVKDLKDKSAKDSKDDAKDNNVGVPKNDSGTNKSTSVSTGIVETPKTDSFKKAAVDNVNTNANPNVPKSVGTNTNVSQSNHSNHNSSNNVAPNNNNNISNNHVSHIGLGTSKAIELEVQRNMDKLISTDGTLIDNSVKKSANDRIREARTMIAADVQPIKITVREKPSDIEVQSGNVRLPVNVSNGINDIRPSLPQNNHQQSPPTSNEPSKEEPPKNACSRFFTSFKDKISCECCKKCKNLRPGKTNQAEHLREENEKTKGCFPWMKRHKEKDQSRVTINIENETEKKKFWDRIKCCNRNKIGDTGSCFPTGRRKESWMDSRETMLSNAEQSRGCSKVCCKNFFRKMFCINLCCKKKEVPPPESRKASIISSNKKKSLTPGTTLPPPPEDTTPKIDISLVEHTSHMRGAIPVLPVYLAWFCLFLNCIFPGSGTAISGLFCLCIGKPRFSQKDGIKPRIGAFIIDLIIGFSQFFTVLFCLVGWGWSIWWGVIMIKVAKKHKKIRHMEVLEENASKPIPVGQSNNRRDPAHGS